MPDQRIITLFPVTPSPVIPGQELVLRQGDANPKNIVLYPSVRVIPSPASANTIVLRPLPIADVVRQYLYLYQVDATPKNIVLRGPTVTITGPQTFTPTVGGTISFSGVATTNFVPAGGGATTYTPTVGGTVTFSGTAQISRTKVVLVSGQITFSGAAAVARTRAYTPSGTVTFSGTAPVARTVAYTPSGGITFSGEASLARVLAPVVGGSAVFGGAAFTRLVPAGGAGQQVRFYNGVSKAPMSGISVVNYSLNLVGDDSYEITYSSGVSDNKTDSPNYEGIEPL